MPYMTHAGQNADATQQEKLDFIVSMTNLTWPAVAAISGGFQTLTGVGMRTSQQLNANFTQAQAGIMAAGGVASLALFDMTQKAMEFNREMALVKGLIGDISNREMAQLSGMAKKLAVDFGEAPVEIAKGFQMVARAGIGNSADQVKVLANGMRLAKIEGMDVADAVKEVITATTLFGDSYTNVERYASAIAHAANVSVTSAKQIGEALKYVGGGAKEHWSIEETLGAIATLSQKGVEGSTAGISIRSFMVYILREMPKSQKALSQIGMTFDDFWEKVNGKRVRLKPFQDIIKMMSEAMYSKGMGRGDMMKLLAQFGEPRMMQQYIKLFPSQDELQNGTWLLAQFNSEMQKTYDMQSRLQNVLNSTQEKWNQMMSGIQVAEISIAEGTLPALGAVADAVKGISMAVGSNKIASAGIAAGLSTLAMAAGILVLAWGKGAVGYMFAEATNKVKNSLGALVGTMRSVNRVAKESPFSVMEKDVLRLERRTKSLKGAVRSAMGGRYEAPEGTKEIMKGAGMGMTPELELGMKRAILARKQALEEKGMITKGMDVGDALNSADLLLAKRDPNSELYRKNYLAQKYQREYDKAVRRREYVTEKLYQPGVLAAEKYDGRNKDLTRAIGGRHLLMKELGLTQQDSKKLHEQVLGMSSSDIASLSSAEARKTAKSYQKIFVDSQGNPIERTQFGTPQEQRMRRALKYTGEYDSGIYQTNKMEEVLAGKEIELSELNKGLVKEIRGRGPGAANPKAVKATMAALDKAILKDQAKLTALDRLTKDEHLSQLLTAGDMKKAFTYIDEKHGGLDKPTFSKLKKAAVEVDPQKALMYQLEQAGKAKEELERNINTGIATYAELAESVSSQKIFAYKFKDKVSDFLNKWGKVGDYAPGLNKVSINSLTKAIKNAFDGRYKSLELLRPLFGKQMDAYISKSVDTFTKRFEDILKGSGAQTFTDVNKKLQQAQSKLNLNQIQRTAWTKVHNHPISQYLGGQKPTLGRVNKHGKWLNDAEGFMDKRVYGGHDWIGLNDIVEGRIQRNYLSDKGLLTREQQKELSSIEKMVRESELAKQGKLDIKPGQSLSEKILDKSETQRLYNRYSKILTGDTISPHLSSLYKDREKAGADYKNIDKFIKKTPVNMFKSQWMKDAKIERDQLKEEMGFLDKEISKELFKQTQSPKAKALANLENQRAKKGQEYADTRDAVLKQAFPGFKETKWDKRIDKEYEKTTGKKVLGMDEFLKKKHPEYIAGQEDYTIGQWLEYSKYKLKIRETLNKKFQEEKSNYDKIRNVAFKDNKFDYQLKSEEKAIQEEISGIEKEIQTRKKINERNKKKIADYEKLNKMIKDKNFFDMVKLNTLLKIGESESLYNVIGKRLPRDTQRKLGIYGRKMTGRDLAYQAGRLPDGEDISKGIENFFNRIDTSLGKISKKFTDGIRKIKIREFFYGTKGDGVSLPGTGSWTAGGTPGWFAKTRFSMGQGRDKAMDFIFGAKSQNAQTAKEFVSLGFLKDFKNNLLPNIPLLGSLSSVLGVSVGAIPVFGAAILVAGTALLGLAMWWTRWNQQMEIATKKMESYKKQATNLEQREDQALNKVKAAKTQEEKAAFKKDLGEARSDLAVVYDRMAGINKQIFKLRSENPFQYSPILRKEQGPSWYRGNALDQFTKAVNPASWASGEMLARVLGAEKPTANNWLTGPREQMLAEAYQVEEQRTGRVQALDSSQEGQIAMLEKQLKGGKIDKATFDKQTAKAYSEYAEKRTKLDRGFDRQLAPIVGSSNVEATKKLYQAEEQAKTQRLLLANAAFKLIGAIGALISAITLPFRLLFGGDQSAYAPTDEEGQMPGSEDNSKSIESMVSEMQKSIDKIDEVKNAINDMANGMLYEMYKANYTIDFIRGLLDYMTNPSKWLNPAIKAPRPDSETYETWVQKNKLGMEHRAPYYAEGEKTLRDEEKKKRLASGEIDPATLLAQGEITPEQARQILEMNRAKAAKAARGRDTTLGMTKPTDKEPGKVKSALESIPFLGDLFQSPPSENIPGASLPAKKVDTGIGGAGPEYNDSIGTPQLSGTTKQLDSEKPGVKPSEASSQLGGALGGAASMYLPPGLDTVAGVAKDKMTQTGNLPSDLTSVPDIGGGSFSQAPDINPPGDVVGPNQKPLPIGTSGQPPLKLGRFQKQKEQKESLIDTLGKIFKTIADATGLSWLAGKIWSMLSPEKKTPEEELEAQKTHLRFQSPIKISKGYSGSLGAGAQSLIFPQLDPDKFRHTAVSTGKEMFSNYVSSGVSRKLNTSGTSTGSIPNVTVTNTTSSSPDPSISKYMEVTGKDKGKDKLIDALEQMNQTLEKMQKQNEGYYEEQKRANRTRFEKAKDAAQGTAEKAKEGGESLRDKITGSQTYKDLTGVKRETQEALGMKPGVRERGKQFIKDESVLQKRQLQESLGMKRGVRSRGKRFVKGEITRTKTAAGQAWFGKVPEMPDGVTIPGGASSTKMGGVLGKGGAKDQAMMFLKNKEYRKDRLYGKEVSTPSGGGMFGKPTDRFGGLFGRGGTLDKADAKIHMAKWNTFKEGGYKDQATKKSQDLKNAVFGKAEPGGKLAKHGGRRQGGLFGEGGKFEGIKDQLPKGLKDKLPSGLSDKVANKLSMPSFGGMGAKWKRNFNFKGTKFGKQLIDGGQDIGKSLVDLGKGAEGKTQGIFDALGGKAFNLRKIPGVSNATAANIGKKISGAGGVGKIFSAVGKGTGEGIAQTLGQAGDSVMDFATGIGGAPGKLANSMKGMTKGIGGKLGGLGKMGGKLGGKLGGLGKMGGKLGGKLGGLGKMGGKASKALGKAGKFGGSALKGIKSIGKKIPFLGSLIAGGDLIGGLLSGQMTAGEAIGNVASLIPGVGTLGGIAGDAIGMGVDAMTGGASVGDIAGAASGVSGAGEGVAGAASGGVAKKAVGGAAAAGGIGALLNPLQGILSSVQGTEKETKNQTKVEKKGFGGLPGLAMGGPIGGILGAGLDAITQATAGGTKTRFKKHSPFTVWRGTEGSLPGTGGVTSIRFPELDSEKFKEEAIRAGEKLGKKGGSGNIYIEKGAVTIVTNSPEVMEQAVMKVLDDAVRRLKEE